MKKVIFYFLLFILFPLLSAANNESLLLSATKNSNPQDIEELLKKIDDPLLIKKAFLNLFDIMQSPITEHDKKIFELFLGKLLTLTNANVIKMEDITTFFVDMIISKIDKEDFPKLFKLCTKEYVTESGTCSENHLIDPLALLSDYAIKNRDYLPYLAKCLNKPEIKIYVSSEKLMDILSKIAKIYNYDEKIKEFLTSIEKKLNEFSISEQTLKNFFQEVTVTDIIHHALNKTLTENHIRAYVFSRIRARIKRREAQIQYTYQTKKNKLIKDSSPWTFIYKKNPITALDLVSKVTYQKFDNENLGSFSPLTNSIKIDTIDAIIQKTLNIENNPSTLAILYACALMVTIIEHEITHAEQKQAQKRWQDYKPLKESTIINLKETKLKKMEDMNRIIQKFDTALNHKNLRYYRMIFDEIKKYMYTQQEKEFTKTKKFQEELHKNKELTLAPEEHVQAYQNFIKLKKLQQKLEKARELQKTFDDETEEFLKEDTEDEIQQLEQDIKTLKQKNPEIISAFTKIDSLENNIALLKLRIIEIDKELSELTKAETRLKLGKEPALLKSIRAQTSERTVKKKTEQDKRELEEFSQESSILENQLNFILRERNAEIESAANVPYPYLVSELWKLGLTLLQKRIISPTPTFIPAAISPKEGTGGYMSRLSLYYSLAERCPLTWEHKQNWDALTTESVFPKTVLNSVQKAIKEYLGNNPSKEFIQSYLIDIPERFIMWGNGTYEKKTKARLCYHIIKNNYAQVKKYIDVIDDPDTLGLIPDNLGLRFTDYAYASGRIFHLLRQKNAAVIIGLLQKNNITKTLHLFDPIDKKNALKQVLKEEKIDIKTIIPLLEREGEKLTPDTILPLLEKEIKKREKKFGIKSSTFGKNTPSKQTEKSPIIKPIMRMSGKK